MNLTQIAAFAAIPFFLIACGSYRAEKPTAKTADRAYVGMFASETEGVTVGYGGLVIRTEDGGKTWSRGANNSMCLFAVDALGSGVYTAAGNGSNVIRSTDGGKSWGQLARITGARGKALSFSDPTHGWAASKAWIGETNDGGKSWKPVALPAGAGMVEALSQVADGAGYLLAVTGELFFSADSGAGWESRGKPLDGVAGCFKPGFGKVVPNGAIRFAGERGTFAAIGMNGGKNMLVVRTTEDGGKTWGKAERYPLSGMAAGVGIGPDGAISVFHFDTTIARFHR